MPFAIAAVGIILLVVVLRGTEKQFGQLLASEFQGNGNFIYWIVSVGVIGAIGYIKELKVFSDLFLALLLVVLFLTDGKGFFSKLNSALKSSGGSTDEANTKDTSSSAQTFPATGAQSSGTGTGLATDKNGNATTANDFAPNLNGGSTLSLDQSGNANIANDFAPATLDMTY